MITMSLVVYYIATTLLVIYIILDLTWRIWKRRLSFLPHTRNIPWLGSVPYFSSNAHTMYKYTRSNVIKFNHLYVSWFGSRAVINAGTVEYIEALLKSQDYITKSPGYYILGEWLGNGLLISTGKKWKKRRTALTGAFHFTILNSFMEIYEKHAISLVNKLQTLSSTAMEIEVQRLMSLALLDVICETSMGVTVNALDSSDCEYVRAIHDIKHLLLKRFTNPFFINKTLYQLTSNGKEYYKKLDILHNFTINVINKNIASRQDDSSHEVRNKDDQQETKKKKVLVDVLLDLYENGEIDIEGIREEVDTFMFEGHDTTSSALSWTLYEIGRNPEIQKRLHNEIDYVSSQECPLLDKIRQLKYTECVIKESLRMYPPVAGFSRALEKEMVVGEHIIPSGTIVSVDSFSVHRNPAYWDKPDIFNPDRFESEEFLKRNPFCYIPFSAGPRNCIGQKFAMLEEKVFVYYILLKFNIKSLQTPEEVEIATNLITHSQNGINIEFSCRNLDSLATI